MTSTTWNESQRQHLLSEHGRIRQLLGEAERLARLEQPWAFIDAVLALRRTLATHNLSEEKLLIPLLSGRDEWSSKRIERMCEEHWAEHAAFRDALVSDTPEALAAGLPDLAEELRAHLDAEERTFLHPHVLERLD